MNEPSSVKSMTTTVDQLLNEPRPNLVTDLVINLEQIGLITSVGLNELIHLKQRAGRCGVSVKLRSVAQDVRQIFQITRLERIFDLEEEGFTRSAAENESRS